MNKKFAYATDNEEIGYGILMVVFNLFAIYIFLADFGFVPWSGVSLSGALGL
jgi:hypothetical protein